MRSTVRFVVVNAIVYAADDARSQGKSTLEQQRKLRHQRVSDGPNHHALPVKELRLDLTQRGWFTSLLQNEPIDSARSWYVLPG